MKKFLLTLCIGAALLMSATVAQADSVSWRYNVDVTLADMIFSRGDGAHYASPDGSTYYWGGYGNFSSLKSVGGSGVITSDGQVVRGVTLTHNNQVINGTNQLLTGGTIYTNVTITANGTHDVFNVRNRLDFHFYETPNEGRGYDNDIFYMTASEIMSSVANFSYGGDTYYVYLHADLEPLTGQYLRMAQRDGGYSSSTQLYGWTTMEGQSHSNAYELSLVISKKPPVVPVPAAVWLMGTGLAGLAAMKRRAKK